MSEVLLQKVINKFGIEAQTSKVIEELTELSLALQHIRNGKASLADVAGEIVDVEIMIRQLYLMYPKLRELADRERPLTMKHIEKLIKDPDGELWEELRGVAG